MDLEFRLHQLTDVEILRLRTPEPKDQNFARDVLSGQVKIMHCFDGNRRVGHCIGNSATGEVIQLDVNSGYRRRGIARKLVSLVVDLLRADGAQKIWLAVTPDYTAPAYQFYLATGWRPTGKHDADGLEIVELWIDE